MSKSYKKNYLASVAKAALFVSCTTAQVAVAQTGGGLDEIIVTSERRAESIQDVPVAVSAFDEASFERLQAVDIEDLHLKAPNVTIVKNTTTSNSVQVYIRGIGRDDSTWNVESGAAIYVDGVYLPQSNGALLDLIEFERVEILRGPQGTLYGKSATGGTIKFVTKRPDLNEMTAVGDVTMGSFDRLDVRGSFGMPIIEGELAAKLDFVSRDDSGFIRDAETAEKYNGTNRQTGRLSLLWSPSDQLDVFFAADMSKDRSPIAVPTPTRLDTGGFGTFNDPDGDGFADPAFGSNFIANPGINNVNKYDGHGFMLDVNWDLGHGVVNSLSSVRKFDYILEGDLDGQTLLPLDFFQDLDGNTFQQEITYSSTLESPFNFVVGGYYIFDNLEIDNNSIFAGRRSQSEQDTKSIALFGEVTFDINEWIAVTGGARYSKDNKDIVQSGFSSAEGPGGASSFDNITIDESYDAFTPKAVLELRPLNAGLEMGAVDDLLIYAQYQEGFKTGGAAFGRPVSAIQAATTFDNETTNNIEFGLKAGLFDNRMNLNVAYFMMEQDDLASTVLDPNTNIINVVTADAEMDGLEVELIANPIEGLTLFGTLATLSDEIVAAAPGTPYIVGVSELKHKPDWHYSVGADYEHVVSGIGSFGLGATYTASAVIERNTANTANIQSPATDIIDARAYFNSENGNWGLELAGQNLTNEEYWTQGISTFGRFYAPESTWSLRFKARL